MLQGERLLREKQSHPSLSSFSPNVIVMSASSHHHMVTLATLNMSSDLAGLERNARDWENMVVEVEEHPENDPLENDFWWYL
jgi:hypothetical protein